MNMQVAERVHGVDPSTATLRPDDASTDPVQGVSSQPPRTMEWRWHPDPTETGISTGHVEDDDTLSAVLLRALAWASLHPWA